jgi:hypothetical protein
MRQSFSKWDRRVLTSVLALLISLASLPLSAGVDITLGSGRPEFTANICQPIQIFDRVPNTQAARPATVVREVALCYLGSVTAAPTARLIEYAPIPETPPPKQLV